MKTTPPMQWTDSNVTVKRLYDGGFLLAGRRAHKQTQNIQQGGIKNCQLREVVVAQLAERSLMIPEAPGSNPVIGNF